jgi:hypothetical protein
MKKKKVKLLHRLKELVIARDDYLLAGHSTEELNNILYNDYNVGQNEIIFTLIEYIFKDEEDDALRFLGVIE